MDALHGERLENAVANDVHTQLPMFAPPIKWKAPDLASLPSWRGAKRVAIDIEGRDDHLSTLGPGVRRGGYICGIAFSIEDGPTHYLPIRHQGEGNLDPARVVGYFQDQAKVFTSGGLVTAGGQYDEDYLQQEGIVFGRDVQRMCVQIADALIDENQDAYNLDAILKRRGFEGKDDEELNHFAREWGLHAKKDLWRLPAGAVGRYAEGDVKWLNPLLRQQERIIIADGLDRAWANECAVLPELVAMTRRGVRIDRKKLEQISAWAVSEMNNELARIDHLTGIRISSIMNARQVARALVHQGIRVPQNAGVDPVTGKPFDRGPSVTKELLEAHKSNEVVQSIRRARGFHKLETTYVKGVRSHLVGDRLHPSYKQMRGESFAHGRAKKVEDEGARFGRTASKHPNVQASPVRHPEIGKKWRTIYIPEEEEDWLIADFSQQEPRTTVHYAELSGLTGAKKFADRYRNDPSTDSHSMFAEISGLPRKDAKEMFLALCYGQGGAATATKLGLPTAQRSAYGRTWEGAGPEAQAIIDQFNDRVPFVRELAKMCSRRVEERGFIVLVDGRRCHFVKDAQGQYEDLHKAINRLMQGSAAVQTKLALVALGRAGLDPRLTVHDEFDFSLTRGPLRMKHAKDIRDVMRDALPLNVPAKIDLEVGDNYGEVEALPLAA